MHRSLAEIPHRQEYPEGEDQHQYAKKYDQDRFDLRTQGLYLVFNLALVHVGNLEHQSVHIASLFAHRDHLQYHRIKHAGCDRGAQDTLAALHAFAHLLDAAAHEFVINHHADHAQPLQDRHPALEGKRYAAREDRKSTRLNSSHQKISYAVFCSEEHTSELQSPKDLVCRLLLEKKKQRR